MAFQIPQFDVSDPAFTFTFSTPSGESFTVPKLQYIPLDDVQNTKAQRGEFEFLRMMRAVNPEAAAAVKGMMPAQLTALEKAWIAESRTTPGESSAS